MQDFVGVTPHHLEARMAWLRIAGLLACFLPPVASHAAGGALIEAAKEGNVPLIRETLASESALPPVVGTRPWWTRRRKGAAPCGPCA